MGNIFTLAGLTSMIMFIAKPLIIFLVCKIAIGFALKIIEQLLDKTSLDKGIQGFVKSALKIAMWAISIIIIADALGVDTASLVAVLGVASLALSLAVQGIFTNVFSGISILMTKPFVVGDYIEVAGVAGTVTAINLMRTTINTVDNKVELVPNGDIAAQRITNYSTEPMRRVDLKVTASYDDSTDRVKAAIMEIIMKDDRIKLSEGHEPSVRISGYNPTDIEYTIKVWVDNANYWDVYFDILEDVRESFKANNITFRNPHYVTHMPQTIYEAKNQK